MTNYGKCQGRALWLGETTCAKTFQEIIRVFERSLKEVHVAGMEEEGENGP